MSTLTPLNLPEIRSLLATYLRRGDLARCIRVCMAWHASFLPALWSTLYPKSMSEQPYLSRAVLLRHRHYVRHLACNRGVFRYHADTQFPNLQTLLIFGDQLLSTTVVALHPHISSLKLGVTASQCVPPLFWRVATATLHNLVELGLVGVQVAKVDCADFWKICARLKTLILQKTTIAEGPPAAVILLKLQDIQISTEYGLSHDRQLDLMARAPQLIHLCWHCPTLSICIAITDQLTQYSTRGTWPHLQRLDLGRSMASDTQLSLIVSKMYCVTELSVMTARFGLFCLAALRPHFPWLNILHISKSLHSTGEFIPEILASCPHLESLKADTVLALEIIKGRRWVCQRSLKVLSLFFQMALKQSAAPYEQQGVFERLSECINLRQLNVSCQIGGPLRRSLDFRLKKGLAKLGRLKQLEVVGFSNTLQEMDSEDVAWMIKNWVNVNFVRGTFNEDFGKTLDMQAMFHAAGIKT
ncbi:hypothetical protein EDD21DRAFT_374797 [Dissophora ornata]|nr:hypothetical protein EDD21DRAFT_374797 [Dissophora ornata]